MTFLLLLGGLATLVVGAGLLVRGASRVALRFGIPPVVIGLTVVAFGTSAPEVAASVGSVLKGQAALAIGNAVGSNIFNVLAILGLTAVIAPPAVASRLIRLDIPIMIAASIGLLLIALDGHLGRAEGLVLLGLLMSYTGFLIWKGRQEPELVQAEFANELPDPSKRQPLPISFGFIAVGFAGLVVGAGWLVEGAVILADWLGVDNRVIGLTVLAAGTSLPELATSVIAAMRREPDIAVGNVVGSNIFNIFGVVGATAAIAPDGLPVSGAALQLDLPLMILAAVVCLPIAITGRRVSRMEGGLLLAGQAGYFTWLVLA